MAYNKKIKKQHLYINNIKLSHSPIYPSIQDNSNEDR